MLVRRVFHITQQQLQKLSELSRQTGMSMAEHVRRALDEYLERLEK